MESVDFDKLQLLIEKLKYINRNYKKNDNIQNLILSNTSQIFELSSQVVTLTNIIGKLKNRKRKAENEELIIKNCVLKKKKLLEKELVNSKLQDKKAIKENENFSHKENEVKHTIRLDFMINCYVCKNLFNERHFFYDRLCPSCAKLNYEKRINNKWDFTGKIAIVTGCRIKIGYEICLFLLRNGCFVIGTTRFSKDAFLRYSKESDYDTFKERLLIYPLDLRDLRSINRFIDYLNYTQNKIDILINNAAQTLRRNIKFYEHLLDIESKPLEDFKDPSIRKVLCLSQNSLEFEINKEIVPKLDNSNFSLSVVQSQFPLLKDDFQPKLEDFPKNILDKDNQQVDLTFKSSWSLQLDEIEMFEFAETQVINAWAPFLLISKLKQLMMISPEEPKFIVNVSSMEGKFNRYKSSAHPHTNMSKAALNMMTRTCGSYYAKSNIFMTSVDTGWVTEMDSKQVYDTKRTVPLDELDGAMRVLDPILQGYRDGILLHSVFLKDYKLSDW